MVDYKAFIVFMNVHAPKREHLQRKQKSVPDLSPERHQLNLDQSHVLIFCLPSFSGMEAPLNLLRQLAERLNIFCSSETHPLGEGMGGASHLIKFPDRTYSYVFADHSRRRVAHAKIGAVNCAGNFK